MLIRRYTSTDLAPLMALLLSLEMADDGASRAEAEIKAELAAAETDLRQSGWLAQIDPHGLVGYNYAQFAPGPELNFWLRGGVLPAWRGRGLGYKLIQHSWADIQPGHAQMNDRKAWVKAWTYQDDQPRTRLLARFGMQPYHIYHELEIAAARVETVSTLPPGIVIRPWDNQHCEAAVALRNRAFAQNWGYQPTTAETLRRRFQTARYESPFSFTAWQKILGGDEQMVGLVHGCLNWTRKLRQANEGEVVWVAVDAAVRGQGIGRALMLTAMQALCQAGVEKISVSTDNYADQPQIGLYTRLGFTIRKAIVDYQGAL